MVQQAFNRVLVLFDCGSVIFYIEIESTLEIAYLHLPSDIAFFTFVPPFHQRRELIELYGLGFGVALLPLGQSVLVIPNFLCWRAFLEKEQVRRDGGGVECGLREPDDGGKVAVREEFFADTLFVAVASDAAVRQDDGAAATGL